MFRGQWQMSKGKNIEREKYRKKKYIEGNCRNRKCGKHDGGNKIKRFM